MRRIFRQPTLFRLTETFFLAPLRKKREKFLFLFPAKFNILIFNVSNAGYVRLSMCLYAILKMPKCIALEVFPFPLMPE